MIRAVRNEIQIRVELNGTNVAAKVENLQWQLAEIYQVYTRGIEQTLERFLKDGYQPSRHQAAVDFLKTEGWEILEEENEEPDPSRGDDIVY